MNTEIILALLGITGTLLGTLSGTASGYFLQRRRDKRRYRLESFKAALRYATTSHPLRGIDVLLRLCETDPDKFNHGIIIQTNGVHTGKGTTTLLRAKLRELHAANPRVVVAIETSLKGTNDEEFALLSQSDGSLFGYNVDSYYRLRELQMPNLRATVIAGYGISESFFLSERTGAKSMISVLFDEDTPTYHPSLWSAEFAQLYSDFTSDWSTFAPIFSRMPMYGIKDEFNYAWATSAIKRGKDTYGWRWYDAKYAPYRRPTVEAKFQDIIQRFFLRSNQEYYSTLTGQPGAA